jgi:hypothetical protein
MTERVWEWSTTPQLICSLLGVSQYWFMSALSKDIRHRLDLWMARGEHFQLPCLPLLRDPQEHMPCVVEKRQRQIT